jgi:hypothetical protein
VKKYKRFVQKVTAVTRKCKESKSTKLEISFERIERDHLPQLAFHY